MKKGDHGPNSKLIHIRLRSPNQFTKMRTVDVGNGVKQVYGKVKGKDEWRPQNIMVPKTQVKKKGSKVSIKSKNLQKHLRSLGISISKVKQMRSRGVNDYKHPAPKCPGAKLRSRGHGRGKGTGKGKGPIGRMKR